MVLTSMHLGLVDCDIHSVQQDGPGHPKIGKMQNVNEISLSGVLLLSEITSDFTVKNGERHKLQRKN